MNQSGNVVSNEPVASSGFYVDLLKSCISELEKQLLEKNAVINFLTLQSISKPQDKTTCKFPGDWFAIKYLTSNRVILVILELLIYFSNCQW